MKWLIWLVVLMLAVSCAGASEQESVCADYEEMYRDVLDRFCGLITDGAEECGEFGGDIGVMELTMSMTTDEALQSVGYCIADVNEDGVKELLIGSTGVEGNGQLYAVYTCVDGVPTCAMQGWARSRYYLLEDGGFLYEGSSGAAESAAGECVLSGSGIEWVDFYFTGFAPGSIEKINVYLNQTGEWDAEHSKLSDENTFRTRWEELNSRIALPNYTTLAEYLNRPTVRAAWGVCVGAEYILFVAERSEEECIVVFLPEERVSNFYVLSLEAKDVTEAGEVVFAAQEMYFLEELTPEMPISVMTAFDGDIPSLGVAYTDADGTEKVFGVYVSGYDGSLGMSEIQLAD